MYPVMCCCSRQRHIAGSRMPFARCWSCSTQRSASSTVAALPRTIGVSLRARIGRLVEPLGDEIGDDRRFADYVLDLSDQETPQDFEPTPVVEEGEAQLGTGERQRLQAFVRRAAMLRGDADPKLIAAYDA